jgi:hypothetical protein
MLRNLKVLKNCFFSLGSTKLRTPKASYPEIKNMSNPGEIRCRYRYRSRFKSQLKRRNLGLKFNQKHITLL